MQARWWQWLVLVVLLNGAWLGGSLRPAQALQVGDKAPEFTLPGTTAEAITLADYLGKKYVVLFFYIGAFTKG